jgi:hypothetical protein
MSDAEFRQYQRRAVREFEQMFKSEQQLLTMKTLTMSIHEDTEPCLNSCSKLHRLSCGHTVHTQVASMCGSNCAAPISNFAPFLCIICKRWKLAEEGKIKRKSS